MSGVDNSSGDVITDIQLRFLEALDAAVAAGGQVTVSAQDARALMDAYSDRKREAEYWMGAAVYLADIHVANGGDAEKKSTSKSARRRLRDIMITALAFLEMKAGGVSPTRQARRLENVIARLKDQIARVPEA